MKSKKKKNAKKDFQKVKLKVGKGKLAPSNATDTSFSAKSLSVIGQYSHQEQGDGESDRPIKVLFNNLKNSNQSVRFASLAGLKELMTKSKSVNHIDELIKRIPIVLTDEDIKIRESGIELVKIMLGSVDVKILTAFSQTFSALCTSLLSHINWAVKLDGLKMTSLLLEKIPDDKVLSTKTQTSLIRIIASTKKKELRNRILLLLRQLFTNLARKSPTQTDPQTPTQSNGNCTYKFNSNSLRSIFKQSNTVVPYRFEDPSQSVSASEEKKDSIVTVLQPAIEQVWLECCHDTCQVNRAEYELILALFEIVKVRLLESKIHPWLKNRFFKGNSYPASMKANSVKLNRINVQLGELFLISLSSRRKMDDADWSILEMIEAHSVQVFSESAGNQLEIEITKILIQISCSAERIRKKFNHSTKSSSLRFITDSYLLEGKLNASKRLLLEVLLLEIGFENVARFFEKNSILILENLLEQHQTSMSTENMTLAMSIENSIHKTLVGLNQLMRTKTGVDVNAVGTFIEENLQSFCLMSVTIQIALMNVLTLLDQRAYSCISENCQIIIEMWKAQIIEPRFMLRLVDFMPRDALIYKEILFRSVWDENWSPATDKYSITWLHRNLANHLENFELSDIDSTIDDTRDFQNLHWEVINAKTTVLQLILKRGLTENSIKESNGILFSDFRNEIEPILIKTDNLLNVLIQKEIGDINDGKSLGEYLLDLAKRRTFSESDSYWKLYEKLERWKNEVWCQLLKSQISALT